jgi:hypothetical protein
MMSYVATHPEKLDATKQAQWQKLAKLSNEDMSTVINLESLGVPVRKRGKTSGLNFGRKRKRAVRKVLLYFFCTSVLPLCFSLLSLTKEDTRPSALTSFPALPPSPSVWVCKASSVLANIYFVQL